jgi:hypothetical protein
MNAPAWILTGDGASPITASHSPECRLKDIETGQGWRGDTLIVRGFYDLKSFRTLFRD